MKLWVIAAVALAPVLAPAQGVGEVKLQTASGPLVARPLKHGSVLVQFGGKSYYVDPSGLPNVEKLPKADAIFITHEHGDHLDPRMIDALRKAGTVIIANARSAERVPGAEVMKNGDKRTVLDVTVEAVPAYNIERTNFHPKGRDNGYILSAGGKRVYFAADTEATPEMKALRNIDLAFLPINLPFTMPPKDATEAAKAFRPKMLVPYHQGASNPQEVADALKGTGIEVIVIKLP